MGNSFTVGSSSAATTTSNLHRILTAMIEQTHSKNFIQDRVEDQIAADVIPIDVLIAGNAQFRDSHGKAFGILRSTSGITSVISSSIFIWMIMRSHDRLSTTQHRLLLGLCISDIILSLSYSTFNATAPSENDYMTWNAKGNQATCTAQGFLLGLGGFGGLLYNAALTLYFLAVVKYKKSEEFIRAKIEPFLHTIPIVLALAGSVSTLVKKQVNDNGDGLCISPFNTAPHCIGYDIGEIREGFEIPCWRGIDGALAALISGMVFMLTPALIMMVSLGMIYSAVRTQEKKLAKYGVGALRFNLQQQSVSTTPRQWTDEDKQSSGIWGRMTMVLTALSYSLSRIWLCKKINKPITRSNNSKQAQSRAVMHKAFGYTFAWFLSYGCYMIGRILELVTGSFPLILHYLTNIIGPLQGLFNLLIFMYPKIITAKKSKKGGGETVSWCQAFATAFWSRGKGDKNQSSRLSNLRCGGGNGLPRKQKTKDEGAASDNVKSPKFSRIKKKKKMIADTPGEEEKCEIQVPDNMNSSTLHAAASTAMYAPNISSMTETAFRLSTVNPPADDMNGMKKPDFAENVNVGGALSDALEDLDDNAISNQDEEEEMEQIEEGGDVATESPAISADIKGQKGMSSENQVISRDDVNADIQ